MSRRTSRRFDYPPFVREAETIALASHVYECPLHGKFVIAPGDVYVDHETRHVNCRAIPPRCAPKSRRSAIK